MGATLKERRHVEDEGLRLVNSCHRRTKRPGEHPGRLMVVGEEGAANSVPAAAVIQRPQALFGFTGRKGCVGGRVSLT